MPSKWGYDRWDTTGGYPGPSYGLEYRNDIPYPGPSIRKQLPSVRSLGSRIFHRSFYRSFYRIF